MKRLLFGLVAGALALGSIALVSAQAPASPKDQCKAGYANFIDPATGQPFKNQGQCVSHVNKGGALVPVVAPMPSPTPTPDPLSDLTVREFPCSFRQVASPAQFRVSCTVTISNTGAGVAVIPADAVLLRHSTGIPGTFDSYSWSLSPGYYLADNRSCTNIGSGTRCTVELRAAGQQAIAPGQTLTFQHEHYFTSFVPVANTGAETTSVVDPGNTVPESNESNNQLERLHSQDRV